MCGQAICFAVQVWAAFVPFRFGFSLRNPIDRTATFGGMPPFVCLQRDAAIPSAVFSMLKMRGRLSVQAEQNSLCDKEQYEEVRLRVHCVVLITGQDLS